MGRLKVFTYNVRASQEQQDRWESAAVAHGCMTVGSWLAQAADAYLEGMAKAGYALPLAWKRGRFLVSCADSYYATTASEIEVKGTVSNRFGVFRGSSLGPDPSHCPIHSLVHLPTRRIIATLSFARDCKRLASELTLLRIDWNETDPEKVLLEAPDLGKAQSLIQRYRREEK